MIFEGAPTCLKSRNLEKWPRRRTILAKVVEIPDFDQNGRKSPIFDHFAPLFGPGKGLRPLINTRFYHEIVVYTGYMSTGYATIRDLAWWAINTRIPDPAGAAGWCTRASVPGPVYPCDIQRRGMGWCIHTFGYSTGPRVHGYTARVHCTGPLYGFLV